MKRIVQSLLARLDAAYRDRPLFVGLKARLLAGSPAEIVRLTGREPLDPAAYEGAGLIFVAKRSQLGWG